MPAIDLVIVREGDPVPWPDLNRAGIEHRQDETWKVALLEHGMVSGLPSVALRVDYPADPSIAESTSALITETSLASFIALLAAARGAFPEAFAGGPFDPGDSGSIV